MAPRQFLARSAAASSGPPTAVRILDRRQATTPLLPALAAQCRLQRRVEALVPRGDKRRRAVADERGELGVAAAGDKVQRGVPVARHAEEASRSRARRHCAAVDFNRDVAVCCLRAAFAAGVQQLHQAGHFAGGEHSKQIRAQRHLLGPKFHQCGGSFRHDSLGPELLAALQLQRCFATGYLLLVGKSYAENFY